MGLSPGTRLGPYEVLSPLGAGGMGEVWKARDSRVDRVVALKVLPESFLEGKEGGERKERFEREARALASLNHPNVAVLYSFEEVPGASGAAPLHILTMELLEGESLRGKIGAPLQSRRAVEIAVQIAHGLAAAHEKGIVHRDLKPENVFVTKDGRIKLLDFGIAKLTQATLSSVSLTEAPTETPATGAGVVVGTVGYMSPEQVLGKAIDARSDLFSLGVVLYEMLSGKRPFQRDTAVETMTAILREEPPDLADTGRNISPGLDRIVRHCLEKEPSARFQAARDVAFALEALTGASPSSPALVRPPARKSRRLLAAAAVAVLFAAVPFAFVAGRRTNPPEPPVYKQLTWSTGRIYSARFAPDGQTILYSASWEEKPRFTYIKRPESPDSVPLDLPSARLLAISASGELAILLKTTRAHAGVNRGTLARVALTGGTPREVAENVNEVDWAPNGSFVFARDVDERGRLEHPPGKVLYETKGHVSSPRFSPRADLIAFADHPVPDDNRGAVAIVDLNGRKRTLTREFPALSKLAWSPSGDEIWFTASPAGGDLSLWGVTPGGRLRAIARMPASVYLEDVRHGRALMTRMNHRIAIRWLAPGDSRERDLTWFGQSIVTGLSEDGRTIVFQEMGEPAEPEYDVCLWRADGAPVKLGRGYSGNLSPDGKWVVSLDRSIKQGSPHVLLPTGPSEPRKVEVPGLINSILVDWFPDGKHLLAIGQKEERSPERLFVADLDGGAPRPLTPEGVVGQRAISADGLLVAVAGPDRQIRLYPVGGGAPRPVPAAVEGDTPVQWSPDGRWLYVQPKTGPGPVRVFRIDLRAGTRELWRESTLDDPLASKFRVHVSRDGNSYAYFYERWTSDLYVVDGLK